MKRIVNLYFLALMIAIFFVSCEKQCHYKWKDKDIPPLSETGYNTCKAIKYNYSFFQGQDNKIMNQLYRDTIRVCGWFDKRSWENGEWFLTDDPEYAVQSIGNQLPEISVRLDYYSGYIPDTVDISRQCYVTGLLSFDSFPTNGGSCTHVYPVIVEYTYFFE